MDKSVMISVTSTGDILQSEPTNVQEFSGILLNAILSVFIGVIERQETDEDKYECKMQLYDMFNLQASTFLEQLAPDRELRPDLTAEAIMEAENAILDRMESDS